MSSPSQTIETARLILRPVHLDDAATLHGLYQAEGVLRYFPNPVPPPLERVRRSIEQQGEHWAKYGYGRWAIVPASEQDLIGWVALQYLAELEETEVAYLLGRPWWGRGFATEAAQAVLGFGFEACALDHIIALVHPENMASQRVITKCGLAYVETIHLWDLDMQRYCRQRN